MTSITRIVRQSVGRFTHGHASAENIASPDKVTLSGAKSHTGARRLAALALALTSLAGGAAVAFPALMPAQPPPIVQVQAPPGTYINPVTTSDSADPFVTPLGPHGFELETTGQDPAGAFRMFHTTDLVHYTPDGHIFTPATLPKWATGDFWAPEIHAVGDRYVAYFTARNQQGVLCIGAAVSNQADGPYRDIGQPLVALPHLGAIDPTFLHTADGHNYLYYKEDGNGATPVQPSRIMVVPLSNDGLHLTGTASPVAQNDPALGDGAVLEAPEVAPHGQYYYLYDARNNYASSDYGEVVFRSTSPTGPFERDPQPLLQSGPGTLQGPGHASAPVTEDGKTWLVYAGWYPGHVGQSPGRADGVDELRYGLDGWPYVAGGVPSTTPQPLP